MVVGFSVKGMVRVRGLELRFGSVRQTFYHAVVTYYDVY